MSKFKTLDQVSTILNTTNNATAILKHSYELERIIDIKNGSEVAIHLRNVLTKDITFKGLKDVPSNFIYEDILDMIMKRYYFLTPLEIELALQMDRYGELENKESHYQFYGTEYVGSILKRFLSWKQDRAMELNLNRVIKIEHEKEDINQINNDYLEMILKEIKSGKNISSIRSHLIYHEIPKEELLTKEEALKLFEEQSEIVKNKFELKKLNEKDTLRVKQITECFNFNFETDVKKICRNIVTCNWLIKKYNLKIENENM